MINCVLCKFVYAPILRVFLFGGHSPPLEFVCQYAHYESMITLYVHMYESLTAHTCTFSSFWHTSHKQYQIRNIAFTTHTVPPFGQE